MFSRSVSVLVFEQLQNNIYKLTPKLENKINHTYFFLSKNKYVNYCRKTETRYRVGKPTVLNVQGEDQSVGGEIRPKQQYWKVKTNIHTHIFKPAKKY